MDLNLTLRRHGDVAILDLAGRILIGEDNDRLADRLAQLLGEGVRKLVVTLAGLKQIDSSGISTLVRTFVQVGKSGGSLRIVSPQGRVREVLVVTRLLSAIPTFDEEAAALASFREASSAERA